MALETYDNAGTIFLKLKHGHLCEDSKTEREGFQRIDGVLRDGTKYTKWIKPYKAVSGYVYKIEKYDREFNGRKFRGWNIHIEDGSFRGVIDIPFDSRVNSRWMKLAGNIDFSKHVRFSAWQDRKTDTLAFNVTQDGISVPQMYTRDNMGECPEPVQRSSGKWDYGAQEDFLADRMANVIIPQVDAATASRVGTSRHLEPPPDRVEPQDDEQDDNSEREVLLKEIQSNLKTAAQQDKVTVPVSMEQFFGTRVWAEVEKMEATVLAAAAQALLDHVVPF